MPRLRSGCQAEARGMLARCLARTFPWHPEPVCPSWHGRVHVPHYPRLFSVYFHVSSFLRLFPVYFVFLLLRISWLSRMSFIYSAYSRSILFLILSFSSFFFFCLPLLFFIPLSLPLHISPCCGFWFTTHRRKWCFVDFAYVFRRFLSEIWGYRG